MKKRLNPNKYFFYLILIGGILFFQPLLAVGLKDGFNGGATTNLGNFAENANYLESKDPEYYIGLFLNGFFSLLGIIFIGLILYSGFVWMTAKGNDAKVTKAKDNLTDSIIGLIIIIGAYALTSFVLQIFK